jgi:hypothetical protein
MANDEKSKLMKTRNGKIARLPKETREQLNHRLENGWRGAKLIKWLNDLPEVKEGLREEFNGRAISEMNLSQWREGGYADWLRHQGTQQQIRWVVERSEDVDAAEGDEHLCERLARVAAAELAEHLQRLSQVTDTGERWKQFREVCLELWRLRNGTHYGRGVDLNWEKWQKTSDVQDETQQWGRREEDIRRMQSWEEHLGFLMDLMHQPALRKWVQTDWSSREEEWRALRVIYHLNPDAKDTIIHPMHLGRRVVENAAVYNYPNEKNTITD